MRTQGVELTDLAGRSHKIKIDSHEAWVLLGGRGEVTIKAHKPLYRLLRYRTHKRQIRRRKKWRETELAR